MSLDQKQNWITGEEAGKENRRLIEAGVPDDAPEFQDLFKRIQERDDYLYETYGKQYLESHYGKWIAIAVDGRVIIKDTASELGWAARQEFGAGNFSKRKLAEFPGYEFHR